VIYVRSVRNPNSNLSSHKEKIYIFNFLQRQVGTRTQFLCLKARQKCALYVLSDQSFHNTTIPKHHQAAIYCSYKKKGSFENLQQANLKKMGVTQKLIRFLPV
jgi:hypothetical protein